MIKFFGSDETEQIWDGLINIPQTRVSEIIKGNRRITADTAFKIEYLFWYIG